MASNGRQNTTELASVGGHLMRADVAVRWVALVAACYLATGVWLGITEAYRSLEEQDRIFRARYTPGWSSGVWYAGSYWRKRAGVAVAAVPGTSNHGLAIALDINNYSNPKVWQWLLDHAAGFGFSWAQGKASGEAWHWVFVGGGFVPAATSTTPISTTPPRIQGDNMGIYLRVKAGAVGPFAKFIGATYRRDERTGAWRGIANHEGLVIVPDLVAKGQASLYDMPAKDVEQFFAIDGLLEQDVLDSEKTAPFGDGKQRLAGLGAPTGRIIYPGSPAPRGEWHAI
jgi:D-alanyl-D-alanine carboxypeptidase